MRGAVARVRRGGGDRCGGAVLAAAAARSERVKQQVKTATNRDRFPAEMHAQRVAKHPSCRSSIANAALAPARGSKRRAFGDKACFKGTTHFNLSVPTAP